MKKNSFKETLVVGIILIIIMSSCISAYGLQIKQTSLVEDLNYEPQTKYIELNLSFSTPEIEKYGNYWTVRVKETNHNRYVLFDLNPGKPVR